MLRTLLVISAGLLPLLVGGCASAPRDQMRGCYHVNDAVEREIGFCHAVRVGDTLYISGNVGAGKMPDAMRDVYRSLKNTLEANGLDFRNVVKENVYATDLDAFIRNKDIRKDYYGSYLPAATWVQVQRLYLPSLVVEVELVAKFP
jgi:enamine deaminase RidA (YjgF/YER057c/UK114 family)